MTPLVLGLFLLAGAAQASWTISGPDEPIVLDVTTRKTLEVTVRLTDVDGRPLRGVAVTATAPVTAPGASLDRDLPELTRISDKRGRVTFRLRPTPQLGRWDLPLRATYNGETRHTSVSIVNGLSDRSERAALARWTFVLVLSAALMITTLSQL